MRGLLALLIIAASVANTTNAVDDEMTEMRRMLLQTRAELAALMASHTALLSQITAKPTSESRTDTNSEDHASSDASFAVVADGALTADASRSLLQSTTSCTGRSVCLDMAAQDSMIAMGSPSDASIYRVTGATGTIAIEQNLQVPGSVTAGSFSGDGTDLDISNNPTIQYLLARSTAAPSATPTFAPSFAPTPAPTMDPVLAQLQTWIGRPIGNLCYQATAHGFSDSAYHSRCDSTLLMPWAVIVKLNNGRVFGGYSVATCTQSQTSSSTYVTDTAANFLYSFTDGAGRAPAKFHLTGTSNGKYCTSGVGPVFGSGHDMAIYLTNPSSSYTSPSNYASPGSNTYFAGSYNGWAAYDDVLVYYFPPRASNVTAALQQLTSWIGRGPSKLCYQASVHGYSASTYHSRCDSAALTPFAALVVTPYRVFGGYSTTTCTPSQTSSGQYVTDSTSAFLYMQTDGVGTPAGKFHLSSTTYGKYCSTSQGPTFGNGHDMYINLNTPTSSSCSASAYTSPPTPAGTYYSGTSPWPSFSDVLVYYFAPTLLEQFQSWSGRTVSTLCYQASVHGYSESTYHNRCDAATSPGGLLVAVKLSNDAVFGAFNGVGPCTPTQTSTGTYVLGKPGIDFLYSYLPASTATARPPARYVLTSAGASSSHYCSASSGPVFGAGDLTVSLSSPSSSSASPSSYTTPPSPAPTFYAGASTNWASYSDVLAYHVDPDPVLTQLESWIGRSSGELCYQASVHGYSDSTYHSKCDSSYPMPWAVIVKLTNGRIFGGYSVGTCTSSQTSSSTYVADTTDNFLYSFTDGATRTPAKFHLQQSSTYGKYCYSSNGPTFGGGHDMAIYLSSPSSSYTNPSSYANPGSNTYFAGAYNGWAAYTDVLVYYFPPRAANVTAALAQLTSWIGRAPTGLCYQASVHGYVDNTYHSKCDTNALTPFAVLVVTPYRIFGGYSTSACTPSQSASNQYVADNSKAFLYLHSDGVSATPAKYHLSGTSNGKYCRSDYGPTFGSGHDMYIRLSSSSSSSASSSSYASPPTPASIYYSGSTPWPSYSDVLVYYFAPSITEQLETWMGRKLLKVCYQASVHGYSDSTYHSRCDNTSSTGMAVVVTLSNGAVFGGFNSVGACTPAQTAAGQYVAGRAGIDFLYSFTPASSVAARPPLKYPLSTAQFSKYCAASSGPVFGAGDMTISLSSPSSSTTSPSSYTSPPSPAPTYYAGASTNWASYSDVQVFEVEPDPVLLQLESWIGRPSGTLCYQASVHGYSDSTYHSMCDSDSLIPWAVIVKLSNGRIFGGYSVATCTPSQTSGYASVTDTTANFLYSFTDGAGRAPAKFHLQGPSSGKYCYPSIGPMFGGGHDMIIYLGSPSSSYTSPYNYASPGSNSYFAGSYSNWASYTDVLVYYFPPAAANVTAALEQLTRWVGRAPGAACYQASVHGYLNPTYHSKCDTAALTPFAVLVVTAYRVFGAYSSTSCTPAQTSSGTWVSDSTSAAFLFLHSDGMGASPAKYHLSSTTYGKYCSTSYGPTFGSAHDMYIHLSSPTSSYVSASSYNSPPTPASTYYSGTAPWPAYADVFVYYFPIDITEQLQTWTGRTLTSLCYQASVHGYSESTYHSRCDTTSSTGMAVVVKLSNGAVFGAFNAEGHCTPTQTAANAYVTGNTGIDFLFSHVAASTSTPRPTSRYTLTTSQYSKYCGTTSGPVFGAGDMTISLSSPSSSSTTPSSYTAPPSPAPTFYAGAQTNWASYSDVLVYGTSRDPVLVQLESWLGRPAGATCYQASVHGYSDSTFHTKCDTAAATPWVVIVKLASGRVFGGYSVASCTPAQTSSPNYVTDTTNNFLYSFTDGAGRAPAKFHLQGPSNGKYCSIGMGPTFGGGHDMHISLSSPSSSYTSPYNYASPGSSSYFGGSYNNWGTFLDVIVIYFPAAPANVTTALAQLTTWIGRAPSSLCYQASVHGYSDSTYHSRCDTTAGTPYAVLVTSAYRVWGAYSNAACTPSQTTSVSWVTDSPSAFLFLQSDGFGATPAKCHLSSTSYGQYCRSDYGPTFGAGHDMHIRLSNLGSSYTSSSSYASPPTPASTYYAGSSTWPALTDVFVYYFARDIPTQLQIWSGRTLSNLCYQASVHGYSDSTYHSRCDTTSPTSGMFVVVKLSNDAVFGAFNSAGPCTPTQTTAGNYVAGKTSTDFLFSYAAPSSATARAPAKFMLSSSTYAKYCASSSGPVFGAGDLTVSLSSPSSSSASPSSYTSPPSPAPTYYAGASTNWASFSDVLVYTAATEPVISQLESWIGRPFSSICYQASVNGYTESAFHSGCDTNAGTSLAVVVRLQNGAVFGAYSKSACPQSSVGYTYDDNANFLFSFTDGASRAPAKFHLQSYSYGKYCYYNYGPTYGSGHDMYIQLSSPTSSYTSPSAYTSPGSNSYFAGSYNNWSPFVDVTAYYFST